MAEELWLPSELLADENLLMKYRVSVNKGKRHDDFTSGFGNSYRPNSNMSSPVESIETESDEDDYITGLTRKIAYSTLRDTNCSSENRKGMGLSCSPQSTLCSVLGWCECKQRSSRCISRVSSPPRVNLKDGAAWDLLYAAAEEAARMRMIQEANGFYSSGNRVGRVPVPPRKPSHVTASLKNPNYGSGTSSNLSRLSYRQLQATQQLTLHHMMKQQLGSGISGQEKREYQQMVQNCRKNGEMPQGLSMAAWPTLQQSQPKCEQQMGSGMRAVFLGDPGTRKERSGRSGTGVFLPRRFETATGTRKKPGCSTFLIPDRLVQALNMNLESMNTQPQPQPLHHSPDYDAALMYGNKLWISEQNHRENLRAQAQPAVNQEPRLPQEWTY